VATRKSKSQPKAAEGYVAYYRVSTNQQGESGLGLEAQRAAVNRIAPASAILAEHTEIESGKQHINRPKLLAALAEAKKRNATLLIAKLDRLARNVHFISGLMESGVAFQAADMPQANRFTVHILAAVAEHEREMTSQRTSAALKAVNVELAEKGFRMSVKSGRRFTKLGNPRWQESLANARAKKDPRRPSAQLLEFIRYQRASGEGLRGIARRLNTLGLKTPKANQWYASTVRKALQVSDNADEPRPPGAKAGEPRSPIAV
jgi:DNA invertase Pin-like site-specific DNA recombinase